MGGFIAFTMSDSAYILIVQDPLGSLVRPLYDTVAELENMFLGRHFTPDGHLLVSLGESLVADVYGLSL